MDPVFIRGRGEKNMDDNRNENYSELEKELAKLKSELEIQDELTSRFTSPVSSGYWQKRLEEEKMLWEKRIQSKEEEKKILESKLSQQDINLKNYEEKLKDLEKSFERELKDWQEKFRLKEADLLLEKNRILWEEKIKDAESETRQLLEKINTLNETVARLKDENISEKEMFQKTFAEEKRILSENINILQNSLSEMNRRFSEVEESFANEISRFKGEIQKRDETIESLAAHKERLNEENKSLKFNVESARMKSSEEIGSLKNDFLGAINDFNDYLSNQLSIVENLIAYRRTQRQLPCDEVSYYSKKISENAKSLETLTFEPKKKTKRKIVFIGEAKGFENISKKIGVPEVFHLNRFKVRDLKNIKPLAIITSDILVAKKVLKNLPFVPTIFVGILNRAVKNLPPVHIFTDLSDSASASEQIDAILESSIASEEHWLSLIPGKKKTRYILLPLLAVFLMAAAYFRTFFIPLERVREYHVPYSFPTSIALDTSYIWSCDWQSGSVYHHMLDDKLSLKRIYHFPENNFSAIAYDDGALYSVNPWSKKINRHIINESFSIIKTYATGELSLNGIAMVKGDVFATDMTKGLIYHGRLDEETGDFEILKSYKSPGPTPVGVWHDGKNLWSCDSSTNQIYLHKLDERLSVSVVYTLPDAFRKNFKISGFSGSGNTIWLSSEKLGKIFAVPKSRLIALLKR